MIRRIMIVLGSLLLVSLVLPAHTQRAQAQAAAIGQVYKLAGTFPDRLYAVTACGAYDRATNTAWTKIPGIDATGLIDLVQLKDGAVLGSFDGDIYRRAPGEAWQLVADINTPMTSSGSVRLATSPDQTRVYYLGGNSVALVLRSGDGGRTWQQASAPHGTTSESYAGDIAVVTDPATGQDVVVVTFGLPGRAGAGSLMRRSFDGGATWQEMPGYPGDAGRATAAALFVDRSGTNFYAANFNRPDQTYRLYRGTPRGATLGEIELPAVLKTEGVRAIASYDNTLVLAGLTGVFISNQGGATRSFAPYNQGLERVQINDLLYTSHAPVGPVLFVATSAGVFGRSDSDTKWMPFSEGLPNCGAVTPYTGVPSFTDTPTRRYFYETSHSLSNEFKAFWERNGQLPVFGYPLSEEFDETNVDLRQNFTTQYFERERFEFHPENKEPYRVLLGRLGDELLTNQNRDWRTEGSNNNPFPRTACQTFTVGSQQRTVCGPFLQYWRTHGLNLDGQRGISFNESLALFGLPLTSPKVETNPDGKTVMTQWFERARFEYYPDNPEPYKVQLGRLGSEILKARGVSVQ